LKYKKNIYSFDPTFRSVPICLWQSRNTQIGHKPYHILYKLSLKYIENSWAVIAPPMIGREVKTSVIRFGLSYNKAKSISRELKLKWTNPISCHIRFFPSFFDSDDIPFILKKKYNVHL